MSLQLPDLEQLPPHYDRALVADFIARWAASSGSERANKDMFFVELCDLLGVPRPEPKGQGDDYVFEKPVVIEHTDGSKAATTCFIDVYKRDHFVFEAKQGGEKGGDSKGTAVRNTLGWEKAMEKAYAQAKKYAVYLPEGRPPFLITCDIGFCFEVWMGFDRDYGGYGARQTIKLEELTSPHIFALFQDIFTDPDATILLGPARLWEDLREQASSHS